MSDLNCPCCGGPLAGPVAPEDVARALGSAVLAQVVRALARRPMTYEQLAQAIYGGREMIDPRRSLIVTLSKQEGILRKFGWHIARPGKGGNRPLRLVALGAVKDALGGAR